MFSGSAPARSILSADRWQAVPLEPGQSAMEDADRFMAKSTRMEIIGSSNAFHTDKYVQVFGGQTHQILDTLFLQYLISR